MEMVPAARRMAVLADAHTVSSSNMRSLQEAASARGVELVIRTVERPSGLGPRSRKPNGMAWKHSTYSPPRYSIRGVSTSSSARRRCAYQPSTNRRSLLRRADRSAMVHTLPRCSVSWPDSWLRSCAARRSATCPSSSPRRLDCSEPQDREGDRLRSATIARVARRQGDRIERVSLLRLLTAACGRYCCKSPKLPGDNFPAVRRFDRRPPIYVVSITLPRSPVSLSSRDEVPNIFTRKSRLRPGEFLITSAKRLL